MRTMLLEPIEGPVEGAKLLHQGMTPDNKGRQFTYRCQDGSTVLCLHRGETPHYQWFRVVDQRKVA